MTHGSAAEAPHLELEHLEVFACSIGPDAITRAGHVKMMAAVQPFLSGGISKTVNLPEETTVDEVEQVFMDAWRSGVKAVALYRDNCKVAQPLEVGGSSTAAGDSVEEPADDAGAAPVRRETPPRPR